LEASDAGARVAVVDWHGDVADEVAGREGDGLHLVGFQRLGHLRRRLVARLGADALHAVLRETLHRRLAVRVEVALHYFLHVSGRGLGPRRKCKQGGERCSPGLHRLLPGPR